MRYSTCCEIQSDIFPTFFWRSIWCSISIPSASGPVLVSSPYYPGPAPQCWRSCYSVPTCEIAIGLLRKGGWQTTCLQRSHVKQPAPKPCWSLMNFPKMCPCNDEPENPGLWQFGILGPHRWTLELCNVRTMKFGFGFFELVKPENVLASHTAWNSNLFMLLGQRPSEIFNTVWICAKKVGLWYVASNIHEPCGRAQILELCVDCGDAVLLIVRTIVPKCFILVPFVTF